jgi:hypothetical protein
MPHSGDVIGWLLNGEDRANLLQRIAPAYSRVVAHHVTLKAEAAEDERAPAAQDAAIIGLANDGEGVQAAVVRLNGTTRRPDGGVYHITWSLAPGRRAVESNAVIAQHGWTPLAPVEIGLTVGRFRPAKSRAAAAPRSSRRRTDAG